MTKVKLSQFNKFRFTGKTKIVEISVFTWQTMVICKGIILFSKVLTT